MSDRYARFTPLSHNNPNDHRPPGRRDRDRVLYSSAFRRLAGITQVAPANDLHPSHNRLTHTLEVAQIGRSLAEELQRTTADPAALTALGGLDPDVVEAACLAHDLGHPPYGHVAERELDALVRGQGVADGFEGNPQTFRVLTRLAVRYRDLEGINLTRATLCAVLKYPWLRGEAGAAAKKWGAYSLEAPEFWWAQERCPAPGERTLEAELMDWADDVAYAVHDVEDFFRAGLIPQDRIALDADERTRFIELQLQQNPSLAAFSPAGLASTFHELMAMSPVVGPHTGTREDRSRIRGFTSALVSRYIAAARIDSDRPALTIAPEARMEVAMLKGLTWHYVIESRALITQRYGQRRLIRALFRMFCEIAATPQDRRILPEFFRERLGAAPSDAHLVRTVADLMASLTEAQVVAMHHRLTGISLDDSLAPILP